MRKEISDLITRVQQSVDPKDKQANHNINQITTDRIMSIFSQNLPDKVDTLSKYEKKPEDALDFHFDPELTDEQVQDRAAFMCRFASDLGHNHAVDSMHYRLSKEYER